MGAFDGLNLYQPRYSTQENRPVHKPVTYYVSWQHPTIKHGFTGKHYLNRKDAERKYKQKLAKGLSPAKWFK